MLYTKSCLGYWILQLPLWKNGNTAPRGLCGPNHTVHSTLSAWSRKKNRMHSFKTWRGCTVFNSVCNNPYTQNIIYWMEGRSACHHYVLYYRYSVYTVYGIIFTFGTLTMKDGFQWRAYIRSVRYQFWKTVAVGLKCVHRTTRVIEQLNNMDLALCIRKEAFTENLLSQQCNTVLIKSENCQILQRDFSHTFTPSTNFCYLNLWSLAGQSKPAAGHL